MSRLDDIKEQLKGVAQSLGQKIQESPAYVQWQDRYQTMSPSSQKLVRMGAVLSFIFFLVFYPMSLFFTSQETIASFEEKRNLIRELFKTYRESSARPNISVPPSIESLKASINSILTTADLTPEQNSGVIEGVVEGKLIPSALVNHMLEVRLAKLNIKQIVDIGASIVGISDSVKMKDMSISAHAADPRYFDVSFKLYALNVPEPTPEPPPEPEPKSKKGSNSIKEDSKGGDE